MKQNRPEILIGIDHVPAAWVSQVMYGIEEEGCLFSCYDMENEEDVRFSLTGITVTLSAGHAVLWDHTVRERQQVYAADFTIDSCRTLGTNAARYLKGKTLILA